MSETATFVRLLELTQYALDVLQGEHTPIFRDCNLPTDSVLPAIAYTAIRNLDFSKSQTSVADKLAKEVIKHITSEEADTKTTDIFTYSAKILIKIGKTHVLDEAIENEVDDTKRKDLMDLREDVEKIRAGSD